MDIKGARAIVTGEAGSLGTFICRALAAEGCDVLVTYLHSEQAAGELAESLTATFGVRAMSLQIDLTQPESPMQLKKAAIERLGGLDILVNNAAVNRKIPFQDLDAATPELWDLMMAANVRQPFLIARAMQPLLQAGRGGRIVNIASIAGLIPGGSSLPYAVSKAALLHLTRCLAVAMAPEVIVNVIAPAGFESRMRNVSLTTEQAQGWVARTALKREVTREDIADQVIAFCRTDSTTGQSIVIDAGYVFH